METKSIHETFNTKTFGTLLTVTRTTPQPLAREPQRKTRVLVSDDDSLARNLRSAMDPMASTLVQVNESDRALRLVDSIQSAVVFVDLDLAAGAGWEVADRLLKTHPAISLMLLTGRAGHIELGTTISAGMVFGKSASPAALLEQSDRLVSELESERRERNARNQLLIRWLMPYVCPVPVRSTLHFWGINE